MSEPQPAAAGPVTAESQVFDDEVGDAVRYERWLAIKCVACIVLVAVIIGLRVYLFG